MLLSIDPSTTTVGVALLVEHDSVGVKLPVNHLFAADSIKLRGEFSDPIDRWLAAALKIENWLFSMRISVNDINTVVFERPQFYRATKSKGDPNKLVGVLGVGAVLAGRMSARHTSRFATYLPAEWIGQLSKVCPTCGGKAKKNCTDCKGSAWETPRGRRIASRLSIEERAVCPDQNDAIDAAGLGLFHLGRLTPRRVYSNGKDEVQP